MTSLGTALWWPAWLCWAMSCRMTASGGNCRNPGSLSLEDWPYQDRQMLT
jgi:hypothetical protein